MDATMDVMVIGGDEFVPYAEAVRRYGVSHKALQNAVAVGHIAVARPGRKKLLRAGDVERWLTSLITVAAAPAARPGRPRRRMPGGAP